MRKVRTAIMPAEMPSDRTLQAAVHDKTVFGVSDSNICVPSNTNLVNMKLPLRIAVLECDTPLEKTRAKYSGYGGVFKQLLQRGADKLGHPGLSATEGMELTMFDVVNNPGVFPKMEDIDAIVLSGSRKCPTHHQKAPY